MQRVCAIEVVPARQAESPGGLRWAGIAPLALLVCVALPAADDVRPAQLVASYDEGVRPLIERFCLRCHSSDKHKGDVDLERVRPFSDARKEVDLWRKVIEMVEASEMPPRRSDQPAPGERDALLRWAHAFVEFEAKSHASDPGPAPIRRLSLSEYTRTIRELTGAPLDPLRDFPAEGAAGEGFTNAAAALSTSPSLVEKFLRAAKDIAAHAVLLPDGIRFSTSTSRQDWANEALGRIHEIYGRYVDAEGRPPLRKYLAAAAEMSARPASPRGAGADAGIDAVRTDGLNAKYLAAIARALDGGSPPAGPVVRSLERAWQKDAAHNIDGVLSRVEGWQNALYRVNNVGHFRKWQEPVDPLAPSVDLRTALEPPAGKDEATVYIVLRDARDGAAGGRCVLEAPRLERKGQSAIPLRNFPGLARALDEKRRDLGASAARCLAAVAKLRTAPASLEAAAREHGVDAGLLRAWAAYLGVEAGAPEVKGHFVEKLSAVAGRPAVTGWGSNDTPSIVANASDETLDIPGRLAPHSIAVHPSPKLYAAVAWQSPIAGAVRVEARVADAHGACGNGVEWALEHWTPGRHSTLRSGSVDNGGTASIEPVEALDVRLGDVVFLRVDARNGDHVCDLTAIDLRIEELSEAAKSHISGGAKQWILARDVSGDILAGNPHADAFGNASVWSFVRGESAERGSRAASIPTGSALARWLKAVERGDGADRSADDVAHLLSEEPAADALPADRDLRKTLRAVDGPLLGGLDLGSLLAADAGTSEPLSSGASFGTKPWGGDGRPDCIYAQAPAVIRWTLPADVARGRELVVRGALESEDGGDGGSVQVEIARESPQDLELRPGPAVIARQDPASLDAWKRAFEEFRSVFPRALAYARVVPVDEVITLVLYHREDERLVRLCLPPDEGAELDRLWRELRFVSQDALKIHRSFDMFQGFASQEGRVPEFEPLRRPIRERAEAFERELLASEPSHLDAVVAFARRAWRRPLDAGDRDRILEPYRAVRALGHPHDEAIRAALTAVLVAPEFLFKLERPAPGLEPSPLSDAELAVRLSYFLWGSLPDAPLERLAEEGRLHEPAVLAGEALRLLRDPRARALAVDFAGQWLEFRGFADLREKSETRFPEFDAEIRRALEEEAVLFFEDIFRSDRSVLEMLDADHTFADARLAAYYGLEGVAGSGWRRVEGVRHRGRGGVLGLGSILARQSGASRTSPVLRGTFILEQLLGEKLPKPPPNVPRLPDDESAADGLTVRQMVERHRAQVECAVCHDRIDPFGLALEEFDAIGRFRGAAAGSPAPDARTRLPDGTEIDGWSGLRSHLLERRREQFLRQLCRKLVGYALGRSVELCDEALLDHMRDALRASEYRFSSLVLSIVQSRQFLSIRGRDVPENEL